MKSTWDIMKEDAKDTARKKGDYTELAELKKVERDANKRMGYKSKLDRLVENPPQHLKKPEPILDYIERVKKGGDPFKYEGWNGKTTPDEPNALPKDLQFKKPKPIKKVKFEPLKYEYLPMEFDEPVRPKKEIKRPKAEGIASVLNFHRIG